MDCKFAVFITDFLVSKLDCFKHKLHQYLFPIPVKLSLSMHEQCALVNVDGDTLICIMY